MTVYIPYVIGIIILSFIEYVYFKLADKFNIIDKPNERSSHTKITIRGGGIIFPFGYIVAVLLSYMFKTQSLLLYPYFGLGLLAIATISFLDDIFTLSNRLRLPIHFLSVVLLFLQLGVFSLPIWIIPIALIVVVGVINAVNFMDGINGITVGYGISVLGVLLYINLYIKSFIETPFLIYSIIALGVFGIVNFRTKALAFAGDVGSVSLAFILCFFIGKLIITTNNPLWIFLLSVYGIDTIFTIIHRLYLKQNIFQAHRFHLYQILVNEKSKSHIAVAILYIFLSVINGITLIYTSMLIYFCFMLTLVFFYLMYRLKLLGLS